MRFILAILLLLSLGANGQVINASPPYKPTTASGPCTDSLLRCFTPMVAYSFRQLTISSELCVRLRKDSTGQPEQDFAYSGYYLDTASVKSFCGSNNCYIKTWYDQSGNSRDLTNPTNSTQPKFVLHAFQNHAGALYDGTDDCDTVINFVTSETSFSLFGVDSSAQDGNGHFFHMTGEVGATATAWYPFFGNSVYDHFASNSRKNPGTPITSINAKHLYSAFSASSDWRDYLNNSLFYSTASNTVSATSNMFVGVTNGVYHKGMLSEVLLFGTALSTADRNTVSNNINHFYLIY